MTTTMKQTAIRLEGSVLTRADDLVPFVKRLHGNGPTRRADVLREALERGLTQLADERRQHFASEAG